MSAYHRDSGSLEWLYNWFYRFYGQIERRVDPALALAFLDPRGVRFIRDSFLEWACGSGSFALLLAPKTERYEGRDQSEKMLERARERWYQAARQAPEDYRYGEAPFHRGNLLEFLASDAKNESLDWDWFGLSFALHLFPPETEIDLLKRLFAASKKRRHHNRSRAEMETGHRPWRNFWRAATTANSSGSISSQQRKRSGRGSYAAISKICW